MMQNNNPYLTIVPKNKLTIYKMQFRSLTDIELYLRNYGVINKDKFYRESSINNPESFAGAPLETAISYLLGGYDAGFPQFLSLKKMLDGVNYRKGIGRKTEASVVGSRPNVPAYVAGAPKTMYRMSKTVEKKFVDIYMNISYPVATKETQILNRGILTLNLINLLENSGLGVNFKVFQSSYVDDEVFYAEVNLKKPEELLNIKKCFYPMCGKEFLRRVMVRVMETLPVKRNWGLSYGYVMDAKQNRSVFEIPQDAIMILSPGEMGIRGYNIYDDADSFFSYLNISDRIRVPKYHEEEKA